MTSSRNIKNIFRIAFFSASLFCNTTVLNAEEPQTIEPTHSQHPDLLRGTLYKILQPVESDQLITSPWKQVPGKGATHLHIQYSSANPFPIQFTPIQREGNKVQVFDFLFVVLPPAEHGDVLLPVFSSPLWNPSTMGIAVQEYGVLSSFPENISLAAENHGTLRLTIDAYLRQFLQPTWFYLPAENFLYGYRIANISVTLFFAALFILIAVGAFCIKKDLLIAVSHASIIVIALFYVRFMTDVALTTIADAEQWKKEGTFSDMTDTFAVTRDLKQETQQYSDPIGIAFCGNNSTSLQYFMYPLWVDTWQKSPYAVLTSSVWSVDHGTIHCAVDNTSRSGSIIALYPYGWAIARFSTPAQ